MRSSKFALDMAIMAVSFGASAVYTPGQQLTTKASTGQCTRCHTLPQAKSNNLLWSHTLQSTTYKWNLPATIAGTNYARLQGDTYKGATTRCLSCHDGLMASVDGVGSNRATVDAAKYPASRARWNTGHEAGKAANMSGTNPVANQCHLK